MSDLPDPTWRFLLGRGLPQFAAEAVGPVLAFYVGWRLSGLAVGIGASTVVALLLAGALLRRGRDAGLVVVGAVFVLVQALVALAAHSVTVYLAQPVVLGALWSVAFVASVAIGRPLIGIFATAWYPFPDSFRAGAPFRHEFGLQTLVWAGFSFARAALRLIVLLHAGIGAFVAVSILTGSPPYAILLAWGLWHARRSFSRLLTEDDPRGVEANDSVGRCEPQPLFTVPVAGLAESGRARTRLEIDNARLPDTNRWSDRTTRVTPHPHGPT